MKKPFRRGLSCHRLTQFGRFDILAAEFWSIFQTKILCEMATFRCHSPLPMIRMITLTRRLPAVAALAVVAFFSTAACAQDWAKAMFNETSHDFGVVARGAKVEHRFVVENIYEEDAHIQSLSSSCGCSTPQVNRNLLKTWEKAEILVTVDTRGFLGRKDATINVVFDKPFHAEVQLHVRTYIRSDIVVQPGSVSFGSVTQGAGAQQSLIINYAGRDDWKIARVECANPAIEATATETKRGEGQVGYNLSVRLKPDAPAGYLNDQLVLVTNDYDARAARVPVAIEGLVVSSLSVRPSPLMLGVVEAGRTVTRNIVVQGRTPFRIVGVNCDDPRFRCRTPDDEKTTHILSVTFQADPATPAGEKIRTKLRIDTDQNGGSSIEVEAAAQIVAGGAG